MVKRSVPAVVQTLPLRPGEGTYFDVISNSKIFPDGTTTVGFQVDISSAPVPSRTYSADLCGVTRKREMFYLLFAQERLGPGNDLRSMLSIRMSPDAVRQFIESQSGNGQPAGSGARLNQAEKSLTLEQAVKVLGLKGENPSGDLVEPAQTVAFDANFVLAALAGTESCLDFFHSSAFSLSAAKHAHKVGLEPVVRVNLKSAQMWGLCSYLRDAVIGRPG